MAILVFFHALDTRLLHGASQMETKWFVTFDPSRDCDPEMKTPNCFHNRWIHAVDGLHFFSCNTTMASISTFDREPMLNRFQTLCRMLLP
jgi:hypothetical protein